MPRPLTRRPLGPPLRCVPLKSHDQLELQAIHRVRARFIAERTAAVNQMRAFLFERGITVSVGRTVFARRIGEILEDAENGVSVRMRDLLHRLRQRWLLLDKDIKQLTDGGGRPGQRETVDLM
jgi:transposase